MNTREALKAHVLTCMIEGKMTVREGAERLGLSERQVKRLKKRRKENGVTYVLHRNCGQEQVRNKKLVRKGLHYRNEK